MPSLQSLGVYSSEFDTPKANCFATDCNASFGEKVFNISVTEIKAMIEPDRVADYVRRESMAFVCVHRKIMPEAGQSPVLTWQYQD